MHRTVSPAAPAAFRRQPVGPLQLAVLILLSAGSGGAYAQAAASGAAATQTGTTQTGTATQTGTTQAGTTAADTALPAVSVSASATPDSPLHLNQPVAGGALGSRSQLDTPFSTTVVTGEELADRQVAKLGDVFAGDASVSDNSGAYSAWASYLTVRGLQLDWQTGYRIDGMPFVAYGITMPYEQLERVELLKGLSGFMYGFGAPGGVVNYVTKKPGKDPVTSFDVGYRMDGVFTEHADISRRFGPDGMFGARVNATHEEGKTYNAGNINRNTFSAALDGQLTRDLSVDLGVLYQERRTSGQTPSIYTGLYTGSSLPSPISGGTNNLGGTDQFLNTNLQLYTAGVRYQLTPDWTLSSTYSYSKVSRQRNESTLYLLDSAGDYSDSRWDGNESQTFQQWQGMAEGKVKTGPFTHQLVLGASWQRETADYEANSSYISLGNGNLYAPNPYRYYRSGGLLDYRANDITEKALFASDTIQLTSRWSVLGGVRYTNYEQNAYTVSGQTASTYSQSGIVTPTVALMYKLEPNTTLYASYVESLEPGQRVDDVYANGGELLRPLRSRQYELGVKSEHARWSANAAVFRIERGATYVTDNVFKEDGDSIFEGIEAGASAKLGSQWRVAGDVMLLDSWYAKGQSYEGNRVAGAPTFVAAGSVTYAVPYVPGLQVGVNAKFTGNTELRAAGNLQTGGYLLVNLGANYMTQIGGHDVTFRAALDNITNRRYWEFQYADYVKPGDPRSVSLNAKIDF